MELLKKMLKVIEIILNMPDISDELKIESIKNVFKKYSKLWKEK